MSKMEDYKILLDMDSEFMGEKSNNLIPLDNINDYIRDKFNMNEMAASVFASKYLNSERFKHYNLFYKRNSVDHFFMILSRDIIEKFEKRYPKGILGFNKKDVKEILNGFKKLVPGGSIISGLTSKKRTSLSNCFVVGVPHDSYDGILMTEHHMVNVLKRRGGVGTDLSFIRPAGASINNAAITSTGVLPFAKRYSNAIMEVSMAEGRRGAGMLTIDFDHQDTIDVINAKMNSSDLNGVNISIKIKDKYILHKLEEDLRKEDHDDKEEQEQIVVGRENGNFGLEWIPDGYMPKHKPSNHIDKLELIADNAAKYAEPGVLFWDKILRQQDAVLYGRDGFRPYSTNPCGEIPMNAYSSCILLSLNISNYVINPFTEDAEFDFRSFIRDAKLSQVIADIIIDLEIERIDSLLLGLLSEERQVISLHFGADVAFFNPLRDEINLWSKIRTNLLNGRRTGLGVMGYADAVAMMNIKYDSKDSLIFMESMMRSFLYGTHHASIEMAKLLGKFIVCKPEREVNGKNIPFFDSLRSVFSEMNPKLIEDWERYGRRNIQSLAIAPTGTISMIAGVSSGIEPVFSLRYKRRRRATSDSKLVVIDKDGNEWEEFHVVHPMLKEWAKVAGIKDDLEKIDDKKFNEIVKMSPYYGSTTHEIDPYVKVSLQGIAQKYIDNSISITHNMKKGTTGKEVLDLMLFAYKSDVKGFTVYVDGSRTGILVSDDDKISEDKVKKRPKKLNADIHYTTVSGKQYIVIVGLINDIPYEVFSFKTDKKIKINHGFIIKTKQKKYMLCDKDENVIVGDIVSEFDTPEEEFGTRLISTALRHGADIKFIYEQLVKSKGDITHFSKAIARVLAKYINAKVGDKCPVCSSKDLVMQDGCVSCASCGWSKCS